MSNLFPISWLTELDSYHFLSSGRRTITWRQVYQRILLIKEVDLHNIKTTDNPGWLIALLWPFSHFPSGGDFFHFSSHIWSHWCTKMIPKMHPIKIQKFKSKSLKTINYTLVDLLFLRTNLTNNFRNWLPKTRFSGRKMAFFLKLKFFYSYNNKMVLMKHYFQHSNFQF